jgi:parvulin-like peptidyl-prolyl isomerase
VIYRFSARFRDFSAFSVIPVLSVLCAAFALTGCRKSASDEVVLAQVNDSKLTLAELRETYPAEYEKILPREQYLDVIQRWIDDEAVYRQALKRKLDEDPKVMRKLERLRRRMLIEEFLARETAGDDSDPDEDALTRFYEANKSDFLRKAPEFRFLHIRVNSLKEALAVRAKVRGDNFASLAEHNSLDSAADAAAPFRKPSEIPACLHDILNAKPDWVSPPISCPDGVYIVKLLDRTEAGTPLPFEEVRASIATLLTMQRKEKLRESKIRQYKEGASIRMNVDLIPGQEPGAEAPMETTIPDSSEERLPPGE